MFETICDLVPRDPALPSRARALDLLRRVLEGTLYDALPYQFHEERTGGGEYIPLRHRRPSVRYGLCRLVVEDSVALLFSEGHFPSVQCADPKLQQGLADLIAESGLNRVMIQAAILGSVGSVAILMRVLRGRVFFDVMETANLIPVWDPMAPDTLLRVTERYQVGGQALLDIGYDDVDPGTSYWFQREWDTENETWFVPLPVRNRNAEALLDADRTVRHALGFVPVVWIRNLPGISSTGDAAEGACTFRAAIETAIEIDYQLSQAGRGLKYSSDPTLLVKEPAARDGRIGVVGFVRTVFRLL
jgi:hypothetical protein